VRGVLKAREDRIANDAYFTPQPLADEICRRLAAVLPAQLAIWDPCCGDCAFVDAAMEAWGTSWPVYGTDLSSNPPRNFLHDDPPGACSLIVSNPPFLLAEQFVRRALPLVREGGHVAFLLRLSFLAGQRRAAMYEEHPLRYLIPIIPRPSFTPDGKTDASEYAVFVWQRGCGGPTEILAPLRWQR
jgi:hypothetical protein